MAYKQTPKVEAKLAETRGRIVDAALAVVAEEGYAASSIPAIAVHAGVSTGLIYRYFPSKAVLFDEVFKRATEHEIDACWKAARMPGSTRERLAGIIETFSRRALEAPTLAWSLLAEPVDPLIETDRLKYRVLYRDLFIAVVEQGIADGEVESQDAPTTAAAIVGALAEALVGPLARQVEPTESGAVIESIIKFCVRALGEPPGPAKMP